MASSCKKHSNYDGEDSDDEFIEMALKYADEERQRYLYKMKNPTQQEIAIKRGLLTDDEEILILMVQSYPCLYNSLDPDYYSNWKQTRAWAEIAQKMGKKFTISDIQTTWELLKNAFEEAMIKRETDQKPVNAWPTKLEDFMGFTYRFIRPNSSDCDFSIVMIEGRAYPAFDNYSVEPSVAEMRQVNIGWRGPVTPNREFCLSIENKLCELDDKTAKEAKVEMTTILNKYSYFQKFKKSL